MSIPTASLSRLGSVTRTSLRVRWGRTFDVRILVLMAFLVAGLEGLRAQGDGEAVGVNPKVLKNEGSDKKEVAITVYREMEFRGLKIKMLPGEGIASPDNAFLRVYRPDALVFANRSMRCEEKSLPAGTDRLPIPFAEALAGAPGFLTHLDKQAPQTIRFELSKPSRVYALMGWQNAPPAYEESAGWKRFASDPQAVNSIYFRDFPAGVSEIRLQPGWFSGVGISPLDRLSEREKLVPTFAVEKGQPILRIRSEHAAPVEVAVKYAWSEPSRPQPSAAREIKIKVPPGASVVPVPVGEMAEGVTFWLKAGVRCGGAEWSVAAPFGNYPVPPPDASIEAPIIPYGCYLKIEANDDPEMYDSLLAATFFQMRKLKMNTAVLQTAEAPMAHLALAKKYGIKVVVRLHTAGGAAQQEVMKHPSVLTYMIGDEPRIGPKLDAHVALFEALTKLYPQFKPVTCTIFDGYGTGDESDPDRIYNEHLNKYNLVRLGRLYSIQKLDYGVGKPIAYKCRQEATSVMLGLEADSKREWWLVPPFFGQPTVAVDAGITPACYWRIPNGPEITSFMHLALAHRCTGLLGWGTHSHQGTVKGMLFDGRTMAITYPETFEAMRAFGEQFTRIKPVLKAFTSQLIPVAKVRPFAMDAQARWLKTGQMAIYAVNRDMENEANADLLVVIGDRLAAKNNRKEIQPEQFAGEIAGVKDALSGQPATWRLETLHQRFDYLRITDKLRPAEARLYVVSGKGKGTFSEQAIPPEGREQLFDKAYAPID